VRPGQKLLFRQRESSDCRLPPACKLFAEMKEQVAHMQTTPHLHCKIIFAISIYIQGNKMQNLLRCIHEQQTTNNAFSL
jgi:hypothetical protein